MNKLFLFLVLSLPSITWGGWIDSSDKPIPDTESMRSAGESGVALVLTPDDKQFRETWNSTKGTPELRSTNSARLGSTVTAFILFHGCSPNASGSCEVTSEYTLENPDGTKTPAGIGPVWTGKPAPPRLLLLGQTSITIGFDTTDSVGDYKVIANVKDKVAGKELIVMTKLGVQK